ncbi:MAG: ribosome biogenesis GTPase Der [Chloroflexota bacterium]|nr:ribosome biogenesis GTPase Der [Chloroflexota bacterium]
MTEPILAIVGRTNVGKSTLLNRLASRRLAIVAGLPGTTRDRLFASVTWRGREMTLVDTGGYFPGPSLDSTKLPLHQKVASQIKTAITQADAIIFLVDGKDGIIGADEEIAQMLRGTGKPVILAVNKIDSFKWQTQAANFYRLGTGQPIPISAYHNLGIERLLEAVLALLPAPSEKLSLPPEAKLAIVGRPNVGKSTLLNALLTEERAVVDDVPGTTRDSLDAVVQWHDKRILLIDTAGIKRRGKVARGIDYYSLLRALQAINRCDVALLMIDATEFVTAQDMHIARYIMELGRGIILAINKWDLIPIVQRREFQHLLSLRFRFLSYAPFLYISAKLREDTDRILPEAWRIWQQSQKKVAQSEVDKAVKQAVSSHPPAVKGMRRLRIIKAYQDESSPGSFILSVNDPGLVHSSYQRYLEKQLRRSFGFQGVPLRLIFSKYRSKNRREPEMMQV